MNELEKFYSAIGSNANPVIERFGGNAEITKRFIKKFAAEESYENLKKALASNEAEEAFRAAHTLKGICLNLGFDCLFEKSSIITEYLRSKNIVDASKFFPELEREYINLIALLQEL